MTNLHNNYGAGPESGYAYTPAALGQENERQQLNVSNDIESKSKPSQKKSRGFSAMDAEKQRQIASLGGKAAHKMGTAHEFNSDEARRAGRKGGEMVSKNTQHMSEIGRKGGKARGQTHSTGSKAL